MSNEVPVRAANQVNSIGEIYDSSNNVALVLRDGPHRLLMASDMLTTPFPLRDASVRMDSATEDVSLQSGNEPDLIWQPFSIQIQK